ncbi:SPOR domain-containing protein [Lutimonas saemankumensis]|uniref:SPOR domain-containing protein n=1 Tax=Lutimonas saemankumensis TaxID=483016 RepID=UPI001CD57BF4|nr:SPOR domain-containing protein [Lutimonas saemankumensis]MCA0933569.1 SPOR domain-containing protein [Lutimonas saemankumensis]
MQEFLKYRWSFFLICFVFLQYNVSAQNKEGKVRIETSAHVDEMLAQKKDYNKSLEKFKGYKIQIYYGSEKECYEIKDEFSSLFPDIATSIIFSTPQWKLQVGNYRTRLDADRAIVTIKKEYPSAIVLASEIEIE